MHEYRSIKGPYHVFRRVRREASKIRLGLAELDNALDSAPPQPLPISRWERIFNRRLAKEKNELNRYNAQQFDEWQGKVRSQATCIRLLGVLGALGSITLAILLQSWVLALLAGLWCLWALIWLSRIAPNEQRPLIRALGQSTTPEKGVALGAVGFLGGAAAGAYFGAGIGIVGGPLGAIAGTIPGAIVGGILGALGVTEAGHHMTRKTQPPPERSPSQKKGAVAGFLTGAIGGAACGGGIGIAAGPLGAIAGTIPGAVIGGLVGCLSGMKLARLR